MNLTDYAVRTIVAEVVALVLLLWVEVGMLREFWETLQKPGYTYDSHRTDQELLKQHFLFSSRALVFGLVLGASLGMAFSNAGHRFVLDYPFKGTLLALERAFVPVVALPFLLALASFTFGILQLLTLYPRKRG